MEGKKRERRKAHGSWKERERREREREREVKGGKNSREVSEEMVTDLGMGRERGRGVRGEGSLSIGLGRW